MFQFPGFAPAHYVFMCRSGRSQGLPHSEILRIKACSQLPVSLSQRTTSFIASQRQGIHQMPLSRLIVLIINAHPGCPEPFSASSRTRWSLTGKTSYIVHRFACCGRSSATVRGSRTNTDKSLLHDVNEHTARACIAAKLDLGRPDGSRYCHNGVLRAWMVEPDGIEPTTSSLQS